MVKIGCAHPKNGFFATNFIAAGPNEISYLGVCWDDCARAQMLSRSGKVQNFNLKKVCTRII